MLVAICLLYLFIYILVWFLMAPGLNHGFMHVK